MRRVSIAPLYKSCDRCELAFAGPERDGARIEEQVEKECLACAVLGAGVIQA